MTLADEDAHSKVVDVFGVENDAGDRIGDSFVIDDSLATAWQQHFHSLARKLFDQGLEFAC